jgi:hypothetical protein
MQRRFRPLRLRKGLRRRLTLLCSASRCFEVPVDSLACPTQMNEGFTEVGKKTTGFDLLTPAQLQANLLTDIEPVVIGPGGQLYLTDGHHTFTALENSIYGAVQSDRLSSTSSPIIRT